MNRMIFIKPHDVLRFGTGSPQKSELEHVLRTENIPKGLTLRGAIWSMLIEANGLSFPKFREIVKNGGKTDEDIYRKIYGLKIRSYGIYHEGKDSFLIKAPLDIVENKNSKKVFYYDNIRLSSKMSDEKFYTKPIDGYYVNVIVDEENEKNQSTQKVENFNSFLTHDDFILYLIGEKKEFERYSEFDGLFNKEIRTGTGISDDKNTVIEGKLFTTEFIRPKEEVRYFVEIEIDDAVKFPEEGNMLLGGDMRTVNYYIANNSFTGIFVQNRKKVKEKVKMYGEFKLILLTPGVFEKGYMIDFDENIMELKGMAIGSYTMVSGWSIADKKSKLSYRAVPEGSYYVFRLKDTDDEIIDRVFDKYFLKNHAMNENLKNAGFGLTIVGVNKKNKEVHNV